MRIGVDFGGTKIEGIAIDVNGVELLRRRVATPRHDYEASIRAVRDLVYGMEQELGVPNMRVGMGIPGSVSPYTKTVRNANSVWLLGKPFDKDMQAALERPLRTANDANCFTLSEATDGAGAGMNAVFGVIFGTGCGGGLVVNGQLLEGRNGITAEWGHLTLPIPKDDERPGPACYCGRHGCLETWLSGPGLANDFARALHVSPADAPSGAEVAAMALEGDPDAEAALDRWIDRAGRAFGVIMNVIDPDVIILGGGISKIPVLYDRLPGAIAPHVFSDEHTLEVRQPVHGDSSGVRGAAWLWDDDGR